jgi:hypothetical protein
MQPKNCKHCGQQFEPTSNRGHEQLYCTKTCSRAAAIKRKIERNENEKIQSSVAGIPERRSEEKPEFSEGLHRDERQKIRDTYDRRIDADIIGKSYIEDYYEAKIECNYLKLQCQNLTDKVRELEAENGQLLAELEDLENEPEDSQSGMLGSIMQEFKKDPINSVKFATAVFQEFTKPKK